MSYIKALCHNFDDPWFCNCSCSTQFLMLPKSWDSSAQKHLILLRVVIVGPQAQTARAQQQRALERQEAKIEQLKASLVARDAELAAHRRNANQLHHQRTDAESWLDD